MKQLYIILTASQSLPARLIRAATGDTYTHASIAFADDIHAMYSFARKFSRTPLPAGFVEERIDRGFYKRHADIPCLVLALPVTTRVYYTVRAQIHDMLCRANEYRYSILGLLLCKLGISMEFPQAFFCSQFVAKLLENSGVTALPKPPALMRPVDFCAMDGLTMVYEGTLDTLSTDRHTALWAIPA